MMIVRMSAHAPNFKVFDIDCNFLNIRIRKMSFLIKSLSLSSLFGDDAFIRKMFVYVCRGKKKKKKKRQVSTRNKSRRDLDGGKQGKFKGKKND